MTFWDKVINQNKIDSSLISELSDLSYKSIGGKRQPERGSKDGIVNLGTMPFEATITPNKITKEMIIEYQKNKDKPYIDPASGNEYKYVPSAFRLDVADLKAPVFVDDATLGRPATEADVENYKTDLRTAVELLSKKEKEVKSIDDKLVELNDRLTKGKPTYVRGKVVFKTLSVAEVRNVNQEIAAKTTTRGNRIAEIAQLKTDIPAIETEIANARSNIQENKDIVLATDKENKDNLLKFNESLRAVNQNRLNFMEREPNEDDATYLTRMKNVEVERFDTNLNQDKARLEQVIKLKMNLKTVIRKDELIENIVKSFNGDQIFLINKNFAGIKQHFIETFGFDNANLTTSDVVDEIVNILDKILNPPTAYEIETETITGAPAANIQPVTVKDAAGADVPTDFEAGVDADNTYFIKNTSTNNHLYLKIGLKTRNVVFFSTNLNTKGSFVAIRERRDERREETIRYLLFEHLKMDKKVFDKILKGQQTINGIYEVLEKDYGLEPIIGIKTTRLTPTRIQYGWGLSHPDEEIPTFAKFGNLIILLNKLFYKNILSLKTKAGHTIDGFKNTKVSDTFVEIIMKMYKDDNIDNLIKNLSNTETGLYNSIVYMAGLHKKFNANHRETLAELKERFRICEGEIIAGNNNPEVLKEVKEILLKLHHLNAISLQSIRKYLKQFS